MNQTFTWRCVLAIIALVAISASSLMAGTLIAPVGLNPGDHYRLVFVTSAARDATSTNIADYDNFVNTIANSGASSVLAPLGINWLVIGTTNTVDALTHINLSASVPIYGVNGLLVANGAADFWDGFHAQPISTDETGNLLRTYCVSRNDCPVWTGTDFIGGNTFANQPLGGNGGSGQLGRSDVSSEAWTQWLSTSVNAAAPFYGISAVDLVVSGNSVPEPASYLSMLTGILALLGAKRCRQIRR